MSLDFCQYKGPYRALNIGEKIRIFVHFLKTFKCDLRVNDTPSKPRGNRQYVGLSFIFKVLEDLNHIYLL